MKKNPLVEWAALRIRQLDAWHHAQQKMFETIRRAAERTDSPEAMAELEKLMRQLFRHFDALYSDEGARITAVFREMAEKRSPDT